MSRYADEMGLMVSDVYAHAPSSAFSRVSMMASVERDLWAERMMDDRDDLAINGLASLTKACVARAGYFDSSDKRFHNAGGFALKAGFDFVRDLQDWDYDLGHETGATGKGTLLDKAHYPYMTGPDPLVPFVEDALHKACLNADATVRDDQLQQSLADIALTIPATDCPRLIYIELLNDAWEGEGQTGDTDLLIKSVILSANSYCEFSFRAGTDRVGGDFYGVFCMSRSGRMVVDLAISDSCRAAQIAPPEQ